MGTCDIALERDSAQQWMSYCTAHFSQKHVIETACVEIQSLKALAVTVQLERHTKVYDKGVKRISAVHISQIQLFLGIACSTCLMLSFDLRSPCTPQGWCWQWLFVQPSSALVLIESLTGLIRWLAGRLEILVAEQTITTRWIVSLSFEPHRFSWLGRWRKRSPRMHWSRLRHSRGAWRPDCLVFIENWIYWITSHWLTVTVNASCKLQLIVLKLLLFLEESAFRAAPQEEMIYIFWPTPRHNMHRMHTAHASLVKSSCFEHLEH